MSLEDINYTIEQSQVKLNSIKKSKRGQMMKFYRKICQLELQYLILCYVNSFPGINMTGLLNKLKRYRYFTYQTIHRNVTILLKMKILYFTYDFNNITIKKLYLNNTKQRNWKIKSICKKKGKLSLSLDKIKHTHTQPQDQLKRIEKQILKLLKQNQPMSINDFADKIPNYSKRTINTKVSWLIKNNYLITVPDFSDFRKKLYYLKEEDP